MTDFFIVDVFSVDRYTGNQLAVFLNGHTYNTEQMQTLAREMHFSETTFIMQSAEEIAQQDTTVLIIPVRIFTPASEIPFAGHPTLGTAFVVQQQLIQHPIETLSLQMSGGLIPVQFTYHNAQPYLLTMTQNQPVFGAIIDKHDMAKCLNLSIDAFNEQYPVQIVSTGLPFIIVALKQREDVQKAWVQLQVLQSLAPQVEPDANILVFAMDPIDEDNDVHVRVFVPELGVSEDPATGSANGCLCAFLLRYPVPEENTARATHSLTLRVEQGYAIDRPSLLYLNGKRVNDLYDIRVGGSVHFVARAELLG